MIVRLLRLNRQTMKLLRPSDAVASFAPYWTGTAAAAADPGALVYAPALNFVDPHNSGYAALIFGAL